MIFVSFWFSPGEDAKNKLKEKKLAKSRGWLQKCYIKKKVSPLKNCGVDVFHCLCDIVLSPWSGQFA